jgi:hypothetical protein
VRVLQVNQLEDELEDAKSSSAKQPQPSQPPAPPETEAELAGLREENATLQRRLSGLQAQARPC